MINTTIGGVGLCYRPTLFIDEGIDECEHLQEGGNIPAVFSHAQEQSTNCTTIEALDTVQRNAYAKYLGDPATHLFLAHFTGFAAAQQKQIDDFCALKIGQKYGYVKIGWQAMDSIASWICRRPVTWFADTFCFNPDKPICSYLIGEAYATVNYSFGNKTQDLTPDEIGRHILSRIGPGGSWAVDYCDPVLKQKLVAYYPAISNQEVA